MGLRAQAVQAVAALAVGRDVGAVLKEHAHARDARLASAAFAVGVAVGVDVANQVAAVGEHAWQHLHCSARLVAELGQRPGRRRLRAVDAGALQRAGADTHAVGQRDDGLVLDRAEVEDQHRADAAIGLGQGRAVEPLGAGVKPRARALVGKAGWQVVGERDTAEQLAADVLDADRVVERLADLDRLARCRLVDEEAGARARVNRDVQVQRLAQRGDREFAAVRAGRLDRALGWQQAGRQGRGECVARRRHDVQPVGAGRDERELVAAVNVGQHRARRARHAVGQEDTGCAASNAEVAAAGHVDQRDDGAGDERAGLAVKHHAVRIDKHLGLHHGGAAAGRRHGEAVVGLDGQHAVASGDRSAVRVACRHAGLDVEDAAVDAGLNGDEGLGIAGELRRDQNRARLVAQRVGVALRRIDGHKERLAGADDRGVARVGRVVEKADRRRHLRHREAHEVRVGGDRRGAQAVHEEELRCGVDRPARVGVQRHVEAARERLAGHDGGRKAERDRIDEVQVGRRRGGVSGVALAALVVQRDRRTWRAKRSQGRVRRDHLAQQRQLHRHAVNADHHAAGRLVAGVAGDQRQRDAVKRLRAQVRRAHEDLQQCAFGNGDGVDVGRSQALVDAARTQVEPRDAVRRQAGGQGRHQHQIGRFAGTERAEGGTVGELCFAGVGAAVAVAVPGEGDALQVEVVIAAVGEAQHVTAWRVAGVGEPVRQCDDAAGWARHGVVAGEAQCFARLHRDPHQVRRDRGVEAELGVEVGRTRDVLDSAAGERRGRGRSEGRGGAQAGAAGKQQRQPQGRDDLRHDVAGEVDKREGRNARPSRLAHQGLMRTPKVSTAAAVGVNVPTVALSVPALPAAGALTVPCVVAAGTAAW